jgi:hypothetical protein
MAKQRDRKRALLVLNSAESKRLIAKAVAQLPEVRTALEGGRLIIGNGTTNAYVAEELLGAPVPKWQFAAGVIAESRLAVTDGASRLAPFALKHGKPHPEGWVDLLKEFDRDDVFIKGGNAIDPEGNVGVLLASPVGGTVGQMAGIIAARGAHLIAPIGLEKLVPDVLEAARHCGIASTDWTDGLPSGMVVLSSPRVVTEIEALELLAGVEAWHVSSGGIDGSEGAVTLVVEGPPTAVDKAIGLAESLAKEPAVTRG